MFQPVKTLYEFKDPIIYHEQLFNEIYQTLGTLVFPLGMYAQQRGVSAGMSILDLLNYYFLEILLTTIPHGLYIAYNLYGKIDAADALQY
jgi:hypothetical protein